MRLSPTVFSIWQSVSGLIATSQIEKERTKGCIVGLWRTEAFYSDLGLVYADEPEVIIDEIEDPSFSPYQKSIDSPGIYVFEKKIETRKCLMDFPVAAIQPKKVATENFEDVVEKINEICATFRKKDGFLNLKGIHKQNILENLYQFEGPTMDEIKFSRGKNSWKTESSAQIPKCEKRSANELSYQEFRHSYVERNKPVIITDAVDHWKAFSLWSKKYFLEKLDAAKIHVKLGESGVFEGPEARNLWQDAAENALPEKLTKKLQFPELVMARPGHVQLEMKEIFDLFQTSLRDPVEESWTSAYIEYTPMKSSNAFAILRPDVPEIKKYFHELELHHQNIWIGDGQTLGKMHFDEFENGLVMIKGSKQFLVYDPRDNRNLYEGHIPEARFEIEEDVEGYKLIRNGLQESTSMVMAPVNVLDPDYDKFPLFKNAKPMNCTVGPGEMLYLPSYWWHEVQSFPDLDDHLNIAVNFWYEPFFSKEFPCAECPLDINPKYFHLL